MNTVLTYEELLALAKKYYTHGGMDILECWDKNTYDSYTEIAGPITKKVALQILNLYHAEDQERDAMMADFWG